MNKCKLINYEHFATTSWDNRYNIVTYFRKGIGLTVTPLKVPEDLENPTQKFKLRLKNGKTDYILINTYKIHKKEYDIEYLYSESEKQQNLILAGDLNTARIELRERIDRLVMDCNMLNTNTKELPTHIWSDSETTIDHIIISDTLKPNLVKFETLDTALQTITTISLYKPHLQQTVIARKYQGETIEILTKTNIRMQY